MNNILKMIFLNKIKLIDIYLYLKSAFKTFWLYLKLEEVVV